MIARGKLRFLILAALLCFVLVVAVSGQSYRAKVSGIVTDQSGAVIAAATVTLTNINTGAKVTRSTSESGLFLFDLIDPGSYTVAIEAPGFTKFIQENIAVQTRDDITVNA